ncbi:hypothetical protein BpHYR1_040074 [Brachionus plicatilis]|uniref:CCHC-type domain-containing protein n=1 Tax=Brachionus plicatilis TaxID=10195 RepID=A0A3M7RD02_BRAPC|nr:hypothetical protein BpHYR1_040074 [Brachionus plicatilis]
MLPSHQQKEEKQLKKFCKLGFGGSIVTPNCIGEIKRPDFGTLGGNEKRYKFGDRESTRACERGFTDFSRVKHQRGNIYEGYASSESTTSLYGVKERIMSKKRCYISKSKRDACSTKVDATPRLSDFGIPRKKELNGPEVVPSERLVEDEKPAMSDKIQSTTHGLRRTEFRHEGVHDHAVERHIDLFDTLHRSEHSGLTYLSSITSIFYTRVQKPNEDVRAFFTSLWKLAKSAFKTDVSVFNVDGMVKERFINGLNDPYLIMQLTLNKMLMGTSFETLEATLELVNRLESWKTNSKVVMSPMTQRKQVGFHDEPLIKAREALVSEDIRVCYICRKPGHIAAYCSENRNLSALTSPPRTITNAVINNVMMKDSIIGKGFVNGKSVHFLFDTGTVKTIIANRIWKQCKKVDSKLTPNKTPLPDIYRSQASVNATNFKELPLAKGNPEGPIPDEDEKKKVEAYSAILNDQLREIIAQGLQSLIQTNVCEHFVNTLGETKIKKPVWRIPYTSVKNYWDISNTDQIRNRDTAIKRWTNFLKTAPPDIIEMICFNNEISIQLKEARKEMEVEPEITLTRDQWMILSEKGPSTVEEEEDDEYEIIDREHDFLKHREEYQHYLNFIEKSWLNNQKNLNTTIDNYSDIPNILIEDLNEKN